MAISLREIACVCSVGAAGREKKMARPPSSLDLFSPNSGAKGRLVAAREQANFSAHAQASSRGVPRIMRWWEKDAAPNMTEITSAKELAESLLAAGDRLVIVDFYSPGCGGCRALHPKICKIAEEHSDVIFLQVNYEDHKSLCASLHVHVLPFFRFYRGAAGRVCSFSCTIATIKKLRDALAKHGGARIGGAAGPGPAKGLEESELLSLASNGDLCLVPPTPFAASSGGPPGATETGEEAPALTP